MKKCSRALVALERFFACVRLKVANQNGLLSKSFGALPTHIWFFIRVWFFIQVLFFIQMCSIVADQVAAQSKGFGTFLALERFFTRVDSTVADQEALP